MLKETRSLPIRPVDSTDPADKLRHDRMVTRVESMLELHQRLAKAKSDADRSVLQRQIDATDKEIDKLVYELYGLTEREDPHRRRGRRQMKPVRLSVHGKGRP